MGAGESESKELKTRKQRHWHDWQLFQLTRDKRQELEKLDPPAICDEHSPASTRTSARERDVFWGWAYRTARESFVSF